MDNRTYVFLKTLQLLSTQNQVSKVPLADLQANVRREPERLRKLTDSLHDQHLIDKSGIALTPEGARQVEEFEPHLIEEILIGIDDGMGNLTDLLYSMLIEGPLVSAYLHDQLEMKELADIQNDYARLTAHGKEAAAQARKKRESWTLFGFVKPRKVVEDSVHSALAGILKTIVLLAIGFAAGVLAKDWIVALWGKIAG